ncbi:hypothetical protein TNCV_878141 [Trichonephila clavipes]|nr:hypothetical protein TNCV_878141 [Trichonephila clavipes]
MRTETVETFELVKVEPKLLREEEGERESEHSMKEINPPLEMENERSPFRHSMTQFTSTGSSLNIAGSFHLTLPQEPMAGRKTLLRPQTGNSRRREEQPHPRTVEMRVRLKTPNSSVVCLLPHKRHLL